MTISHQASHRAVRTTQQENQIKTVSHHFTRTRLLEYRKRVELACTTVGAMWTDQLETSRAFWVWVCRFWELLQKLLLLHYNATLDSSPDEMGIIEQIVSSSLKRQACIPSTRLTWVCSPGVCSPLCSHVDLVPPFYGASKTVMLSHCLPWSGSDSAGLHPPHPPGHKPSFHALPLICGI